MPRSGVRVDGLREGSPGTRLSPLIVVLFGLSSNQQSRLLDGARALLGSCPKITGVFVGRGDYRLSVAAGRWLMVLALAGRSPLVVPFNSQSER